MEINFTPEEEEYIDAVCRILDKLPDNLRLVVLDDNLCISNSKTNGESILSQITFFAFTPEYLAKHQYIRNQLLDR